MPTPRALLNTDPIRRKLMQRVRQHGTPAERLVADVCRELGLRYRLNVKSLAGSPDLANKARRWAIFVHGCFWHQHAGCPKATLPKRNAEFWRKKFEDNRLRDTRRIRELRAAGYEVLVVWQCETENLAAVRRRLSNLGEARRIDGL
jgi:DNA mismatch endonuclease (patch repair protein)